jgi:hypothetical protein
MPWWEHFNEDRAVDAEEHREHDFQTRSYMPLLSGPRQPTDSIFADDYQVTETMTRHRSRYHRSRPFAVVQTPRVTVLRVRLTSAAVHWLIYGESNEASDF